MPRGKNDFSAFLADLEGKTATLAYSFSSSVKKNDTWYDRWRSDTIFYFGSAVEALKMEARYIDIDTYLREMADPTSGIGDVIINLHSGLLRIGSWPLVASLASWRNIPIVPCSSDIHVTGERKDIANTVARTTRLKVPSEIVDVQGSENELIIKPRDLGMSVGLQRTKDPAYAKKYETDPNFVVQQFVPGFDATVGFVLAAGGEYSCIGGMIYVPYGKNQENWLLTEDLKNEASTKDAYVRKHIDVSEEFAAEARKLMRKLGNSSVYRIDVRLSPATRGEVPEIVDLDNAYFLEANPTPAISPKSSFGEMMARVVQTRGRVFDELSGHEIISCSPQTLLVANQLYASFKNN